MKPNPVPNPQTPADRPKPVPPDRKGIQPVPSPRRQMLELQRKLFRDASRPKLNPALRSELVRSWIALQGEIRALSPRGHVKKSSQDASSPGKASSFVPPVETTDNVPPIEPDNPEVT